MFKTALTFLLAFCCLTGFSQSSNADKFYAEDILEYIPMAAIFGLKAVGADSKSPFIEQLAVTGLGLAMTAFSVESLKHTIHSERPDKTDNNGFPSGHTAISFLGADILLQEYRDISPWIGIGGYALATTTGCLRVVHDRHHWTDVICGAALGIGCSRLSQWLCSKIIVFKAREGIGVDVSMTF